MILNCIKCGEPAVMTFATLITANTKHILTLEDYEMQICQKDFDKFIPYCKKCAKEPFTNFIMFNKLSNTPCGICEREFKKITGE